jgi:hypothetical protein
VGTESTADIDTFTFNHLHCDGVFVIRMITNHAGVMMGTDLTAALWRSYFELDGVEPKLIGTVQQVCIDFSLTSCSLFII